MIGVLDIQATEITATEDVQQQETDAWDLEQIWAELRAELEIVGEQAKEVHRNLRRVIGYAGCWNWKREPWAPPDRPEKLRGLRQYGPARVVTEPPGGELYLKCARRFKKSSRSDHT